MAEKDGYEGWAVAELLGHVRLAGYVREATLAGSGVLRLDVPPTGERTGFTQLINPASLYRLTPVNEETARRVVERDRPVPFEAWDMLRAAAEELRRAEELAAERRAALPGPTRDGDDDGFPFDDEESG